jgi:hypothetical protein
MQFFSQVQPFLASELTSLAAKKEKTKGKKRKGKKGGKKFNLGWIIVQPP